MAKKQSEFIFFEIEVETHGKVCGIRHQGHAIIFDLDIPQRVALYVSDKEALEDIFAEATATYLESGLYLETGISEEGSPSLSLIPLGPDGSVSKCRILQIGGDPLV